MQDGREIRKHQRQTDEEENIHIHSRASDPVVAIVPNDDKPITLGEIKRIAWILGVVLAGLGAAAKYAPSIWKALQAYEQAAPK